MSIIRGLARPKPWYAYFELNQVSVADDLQRSSRNGRRWFRDVAHDCDHGPEYRLVERRVSFFCNNMPKMWSSSSHKMIMTDATDKSRPRHTGWTLGSFAEHTNLWGKSAQFSHWKGSKQGLASLDGALRVSRGANLGIRFANQNRGLLHLRTMQRPPILVLIGTALKEMQLILRTRPCS
jgi:hypothetical protein